MEGRPPTGRLSTPYCALDKKKNGLFKELGRGWTWCLWASNEPTMISYVKIKKDLKQILFNSVYLKYFILENSEVKVYKDATMLKLGCQRVDST